MIYLSGCTGPGYEADLIDMGIGLFLQPGSYAPVRVGPFPYWAADNNCVSMIRGVPTLNPKWTCAKWARMLGALYDLDAGANCLFVLAPDVPLDHAATVFRFARYAPIIRSFGFPVAFALQNGCTASTVPWDEFDVAFLGGNNEWKLGRPAFDMVCHARARGKWCHAGRVNSWKRLELMSTYGADSCDGTFIKHGPPQAMVAQLREWRAKDTPRLTQMAAVPS